MPKPQLMKIVDEDEPWIVSGVYLAIPLLLNILWPSRLPDLRLPLLVLALAYALDLVSVVDRGNLAGLVTLGLGLTASLLDYWRRGKPAGGAAARGDASVADRMRLADQTGFS